MWFNGRNEQGRGISSCVDSLLVVWKCCIPLGVAATGHLRQPKYLPLGHPGDHGSLDGFYDHISCVKYSYQVALSFFKTRSRVWTRLISRLTYAPANLKTLPGMPSNSARCWWYGALTTIGGMHADRLVEFWHGTGEAGWDGTGIAAGAGVTLLAVLIRSLFCERTPMKSMSS